MIFTAIRRRARLRRRLLLLSSIVVGTTCGGGATEGGQDGGQPVIVPVTLAITPNLIIARQGFSINATVTFTRSTSSTAPLTLSAKGLSTGVTATFNPATITTVSGTSQLTITVAQTAPTATDTLIVQAVGNETAGKLEEGITAANLAVTLPTIIVSKAGSASGTVTSSPAGLNCGSTCAANFQFGTAVTLTATPAAGSAFAGWSGGCSGTTTCTVTSGSAQPVIATFNSTAPSFSMTVAPTTATLQQGGAGTATITLVRNNGFASAVNLVLSGAPAGLTVAANPASVTGTTSTLNIAASASLAAGNYPIAIAATGSGVTQQSATLNVQVAPAQGGNGSVAFSFASCDPSMSPIWFAVQSGTGPWTKVTAGANNTFTFTPGATSGIAFVLPDGPGFRTKVFYGTASEITAIATGPGPCIMDVQSGTKQVKGTISRAPQTAQVTVAIGGSQATLVPNNPNYSLPSVPAGKRDLITTQTVTNGTDVLIQKMILRRNVEYANGATAPDLDLVGAEVFVPVLHVFKLTNLAGDQSGIEAAFATLNGQSETYHSENGRFFNVVGGDGVGTFAVPDTLLQPGDFHLIDVFAAAADNKSARYVQSILHNVSDQTVTFGPTLSAPTVTTLGATPYVRLRAQLPSQSAYDSGVGADYDQGTNSVQVRASAAYFGGRPSTWVLDVPDLSGAGYNASWGLHSGTASWLVTAVHGDFLQFSGATMSDGAQLTGALTTNDAASFNAAGRRRLRR